MKKMTSFERHSILYELLSFYNYDEAERWLISPHPQLGGRKAIDCSFAEVKAIVDRLNWCALPTCP